MASAAVFVKALVTEMSRVEYLKKNLESEISQFNDLFTHFKEISMQIIHARHFARPWRYNEKRNNELIKCSEKGERDLTHKQKKLKQLKKSDLEKHSYKCIF